MKLTLSFFIAFILLGVGLVSAQVGINTVDPQADLDINGDLRVREVLTDNTATSVLVLGANNVVKQNTTLMNSRLTSFVSAKGATSFSLLSLELLTGWRGVVFGDEEIDENNDYNHQTGKFAAPRNGIYGVYVQITGGGLLSVGEMGIGIFTRAKQTSTATSYILRAEESYLNVQVELVLTSVDVSPPTRKVHRLLKLNQGDTIMFAVRTPLVSLSLLGGSKSFFSIEQVK